MDNSKHFREQYHGMVYSFEKDTQKKLFAYFLLLIGLIIFLITLFGGTDGISEWATKFLKEHLGRAIWTTGYGPEWLANLTSETSMLGGKVIIFIGSTLVVIYYKLKGKEKLLWKFLFVLLGGNFILLILKLIFSKDVPYEPIDLLIRNVAPYPSGHAMISLTFYLTLAVLLSRKQRRKKIRNFIFISAMVIVFIICISRILVGAHTIKEVLAGFSIGLVWLCLCWLGERFLRIHYKWNF